MIPVKRFTDTEKWADSWFMGLPPKLKVVWIYLVDKCDHSGVVESNLKLISFMVGENLTQSEIEKAFGGKLVRFKPDKWFIPNFIKFQYGVELNPENSAHLGVLRKLQEHGIECPVSVKGLGPSKGLPRGLLAPTDTDKEQDKEKDKDTNHPTLEKAIEYFCKTNGSDYTEAEVKKAFNSFEAGNIDGYWQWGRGRVGDWRAAMETRLSRDREQHPNTPNGKPSPNGADTVVLGKELERVIEKMNSIKRTYGDHQDWIQTDKTEWNKLLARKKELKERLGVKV